MDRIAVSRYRRVADVAVIILFIVRLDGHSGAGAVVGAAGAAPAGAGAVWASSSCVRARVIIVWVSFVSDP